MADATRVRQVRVLIYEGPRDWVEKTIEAASRYVQETRVVFERRAAIEPEKFGDPTGPLGPIVVERATITEHIAPPEVLRG